MRDPRLSPPPIGSLEGASDLDPYELACSDLADHYSDIRDDSSLECCVFLCEVVLTHSDGVSAMSRYGGDHLGSGVLEYDE
jgi:hypothetical protein